jgi:hypothetical protein
MFEFVTSFVELLRRKERMRDDTVYTASVDHVELLREQRTR